MEYKTGQMLVSTAHSSPMVKHYAFVYADDCGRVSVLHNTPDLHNEHGGSVVFEDIDSFFGARTLLSVVETNLNHTDLYHAYEINKTRLYNVLHFNCEHFAFSVLGKEEKSPQIKFFAVGIIAVAFISIKAAYKLY